MNAKMLLIPVLILSLMSFGVAGLLTVTFQIENFATMTTLGVEVYWDLTATRICNSIDWGELKPGENKTITLYVKNTGGNDITGSMTTTDWEPLEAAKFITLEWDFGVNPLKPDRIRTTRFTLRVSPAIENITHFYFNILVTGTEYIG